MSPFKIRNPLSSLSIIFSVERLRKWVSFNLLKSVQTVIAPSIFENSTTDGVSKISTLIHEPVSNDSNHSMATHLQKSALCFLQDWNRSLNRPGSVAKIDPFCDLHKDLACVQPTE